jgi:hypothetical protein
MDFTITAPASPLVVNATITNASSLTALDGSIDLTTTGGTAPYTFMWSTTATEPDLTDIGVGVYLITITDNNGCSLATTFQINSTAGIAAAVAPDWNVYPNPASTDVLIEASNAAITDLQIYDLMGQLVWKQNVTDAQVSVSVADFTPGTYMVRVQIGEGFYTKRLTVIK